MAEREGLTAHGGIPVRRSSDEIRLDIATERQMLAETVDQLGTRLQEKLEWRSYVRRSPYVALGAAAGIGLLASALFRKRTPLERLVKSARKPLGKAQEQSLIKTILFGATARVATAWLESAVSEAVANRGQAAGSRAHSDVPEDAV